MPALMGEILRHMYHQLTILLLTLMSATAAAQWTPPPNPDPSAVLKEARADTDAGRYAEALAKHVWFHHHSLSYERSLYGVRLSFALGYWMDLARKYPPALKALTRTRDAAGVQIRQGNATRDMFHDFSSINEELNEETSTVELFLWLDQNDADFARAAYDIAEPALIESKNYKVCGKYIDPARAISRMQDLFREHQRMVKVGTFGEDMTSFSGKSLTYGATTLVALLVLNGRDLEADQAITTVLKEWSDAGFQEALETARKGIVPERWPKVGS